MCGIAGIIHNDPSRPVDDALIEEMCAAIQHRGPDEWGMWSHGNVGLGMKRLRIIDLSGGRQPISNDDDTIRIVFNGEIYNYIDLRTSLKAGGYRFKTLSDTETILHLYEEHGENCVHHLRGMFAFAIWDDRKKQLFLARDRFGKKPLYYYSDGKKFLFGSEIKSILKDPDVRVETDHVALANYMVYGYVPDPGSIFKRIRKLPPGHTLIWKNGNARTKPYWDLVFAPEISEIEDDYYIETVDRLFHESVKIRMISDVPLGAFLSGGIDSSLVVALMARQSSQPVKTFSIGFDNQQYNELPYARMTAERYGTEHHEEVVRPDAEEVIGGLIDMFDEPFADSSAIPTYYVSRLARRHVTVALSGDGGDEIFAGYTRYLDSPVCRYTDPIPVAWRRLVFGTIPMLFPDRLKGVNFARYLAATEDERYAIKITNGLSMRYRQLFSEQFLNESGNSDPSSLLHSLFLKVARKDCVSRRQYVDVKSYLPGDILTKVDRASMRVSLETRAPLLDHRLAEFAAKIPSRLKIRGRTLKYTLKCLASRYLPSPLIDRPKMGFALPIGQWINHEWREMSQELVLGERATRRQIFRLPFLKEVMDQHRSQRRDHSGLLWKFMVLEMWHRNFID